MVNYDESTTLTDTSSSISSLFSLSKPSNVFQPYQKTINLLLNSAQLLKFEFLEPFESTHANRTNTSNIGKISTKTSTRSKPYSLNKPTTSTEPQNNYNQTAILARLSSISSTFKSIFVRPKNSKQVNLDSLKPKQQQPKQEEELNTNFKLKLFTPNEQNENLIEEKVDLNAKLEKIISRNVQLESKLIKDNTDKYLHLNSPSSASSTSSACSTMSTTSNLTHDSFLSSNHQKAKLNSLPVKLSSSTAQISKWTCMICLSKHKLDVKVCSICGSMQQQQQQQTLNSSKLTTITSAKTEKQNNSQTTLKTLNSNNYLLKTWTCSYCNFSNDSLKVVCMNCRASKQQQNQMSTNKKEESLLHQTIQTKRARKEMSRIEKLNKSNEENEPSVEEKLNESLETNTKSKKAKNCAENMEKSVCCSCKHTLETKEPIKEVNTPNTTLKSSLFASNVSNLITPTKPANYYDNLNEKETNSLSKLAASTNKWSCTVCLVSNEESKSNCVCCSTPRPGAAIEKPKEKWTCSTCLVPNESEKTICVCCSTPKEPSSSTKTKFSELVAAAGSLNTVNTAINSALTTSSNISFGLKPSTSQEPIKFTSTTNFFPTSKPIETQKEEETPKIVFSTTTNTNQTILSEIKQEPKIENLFNKENNPEVAKQGLFKFGISNPTPVPTSNSSTTTNSTSLFGNTVPPTLNFGNTSSSVPASSNSASLFASTNLSSSNSSTLFGTTNSSTSIPATSNSGTLFANSGTTNTGTFFGSTNSSTSNSTCLFGNTNTTSNNSNPIFGSTNSSTSAPSTLNSSTFFGNTNSSTSNTTPIFGGASSNSSTSIFGNGNSGPSLFGKQEKPLNSTNFFGSTKEVAKPVTNMFGSTSTSTSTSTTPGVFTFGSSTTTSNPTNSSFVFGSTTTNENQQKEKSSMFTFGGVNTAANTQQTNSSFNFGSSNLCMTPSRAQITTTATTPAVSTPFVFGSSVTQQSTDSPSLQQVLVGQSTTPSTRVIKKPTRRLKK